MAGAAVTVMGATGLIGFFYLYTDQLGISLGTAGLVLTLGQIGLFLPRLFARLVDRATNDAGTVLIGVLVAGLGVLLLGFGTMAVSIGVGVFLAGIGRGAVQPATASIVSSIVPPHLAGRFLGIRTCAMQVAGGLGSLLFGVAASLRQVDVAFALAGLLALLVTAGAKFTSIPRRVRIGPWGPRPDTLRPRAIGGDDDLAH
jgi:MFS family permease